MSNFETWWEREGQEFLFALNTTTDDDIKLVAEIAWKNGAYCAEQAEQEPVAWYGKSRTGNILLSVNCVDEDWQPLYAKPIEPVRPEPIGDVDIHMDFLRINWKDGRHPPRGTKLYAAPVRTKDLTDSEIDFMGEDMVSEEPSYEELRRFARAVIAADREKNK